MKYLKFLGVALLASIGFSTAASAATACLDYQVSTTAGSNSCTVGDLTFTFTGLNFDPTSAGDTLEVAQTSTAGGDIDLLFQVNPGVSGFPVDLL